MRRIVVVFFALSVPGWSQPAQQPAQPPIVVKVEMPPTNPWTHLVELVVPGIIGAGLALLGVWLTNKNNAATNAANREHQRQVEIAKAKMEFRKEIYMNLIKACVGLKALYAQIHAAIEETATPMTDHAQHCLTEFLQTKYVSLMATGNDYILYANLAPIATADEIEPAIQELRGKLFATELQPSPEYLSSLKDQIKILSTLLPRIQAAARKDLWDIPNEK
jgi:hypothetical protein